MEIESESPMPEHHATLESQTSTAVLAIGGMHCASCVSHVEGALLKLDGVRSASVNLMTEKATVSYDAARVSPNAMSEAVAGAGYRASLESTTEPAPERKAAQPGPGETAAMDFRVTGMHCASCVNRIEEELKQRPGVERAVVNLPAERASVRFRPAIISPQQIVAAIADAGYQAEPILRQRRSAQEQKAALAEQREDERRKLWRTLLLAIYFAVPVVLLSMFAPPFRGRATTLFLLTLPVWLVAGWEFHKGAQIGRAHV